MMPNMSDMVTQVGIVGAGPAGLLLAHLLGREGIESVVVEAREPRRTSSGGPRRECSSRARSTCWTRPGVGERMRREGLVHHGIELRFGGRGHRIDFAELTGGRGITVYGQQEVVKDLLAAREAAGALPLVRGARTSSCSSSTADRPAIRFSHAGRRARAALRRRSPAATASTGSAGRRCRTARSTVYEREYPFGWLGILAEVAPSTEELIYARHERGFALHSMRSPDAEPLLPAVRARTRTRTTGPTSAIWEELRTRLALDARARARSSRRASRRCARSWSSRCSTAGCSWPATRRTSCRRPAPRGSTSPSPTSACSPRRCATTSRRGDDAGLRAYSDTCLRRVWRAEHFSWWMTSMLHRFPDGAGLRGAAPALAARVRGAVARRPRRRWPRTTSGFRGDKRFDMLLPGHIAATCALGEGPMREVRLRSPRSSRCCRCWSPAAATTAEARVAAAPAAAASGAGDAQGRRDPDRRRRAALPRHGQGLLRGGEA